MDNWAIMLLKNDRLSTVMTGTRSECARTLKTQPNIQRIRTKSGGYYVVTDSGS